MRALVHRGPQFPAVATTHKPPCRRIFSNAQLIERFDSWLQICGRRQSTRRNYAGAAKQFAEFLGEKSFTSVTTADVRGFLGQLYGRELAGSTMAARLGALRTLFDFLQLGDQVNLSVPRYVQSRRRLTTRLPRVLTKDEVNKLIAAASCVRDRAILELAYAAGLRLSELAKLRFEDIDFRGRSLTVRDGKGEGGKDRVTLFGRFAAAALREYLGERSSGFVFLPGGHHPRESLCDRQIARIVTKTAKRAGLAGVHTHTMRHTFATHLLEGGMDLRSLMELLGHSRASTTQAYTHLQSLSLCRTLRRCHPHG